MASEGEFRDQLRPHPQLAAYYSDPAGRLAFASDLFNGAARYYDAVNCWFSLCSGCWYLRPALKWPGLSRITALSRLAGRHRQRYAGAGFWPNRVPNRGINHRAETEDENERS